MAAPLKISALTARRFMRRTLLLDQAVPDVHSALVHHGYIQIDPINVCGRMHDLILRNRVAGYREGDLMRHLHGDETAHKTAGDRQAFEHHLPSTSILVAFPRESWPHLLAAMEARTRRAGAWSGRLTPREKEFAPQILAELAARGPLSSEDLHDGRQARRGGGWGTSTLAKSTLQKMFFHGRVLIARRQFQRRYYDLPERVLPAATLARPRPSAAETARWIALSRMLQHRLVLLKKADLKLIEDLLQPVQIEDGPLLHCLKTDVAWFETEAKIEAPGQNPRSLLLAPLDPLIYDRRVTSRLWNFDYTWEVYTPAHKRVRGYYALPILAGHELVGHIDSKADRLARKLAIASRSVRRGFTSAEAVGDLSRFLGLKA